MAKKIKLTRGKSATVDDSDYEATLGISWHAKKDRCTWYAWATLKGTREKVSLHRFLLTPPREMVVDHIDGNGLNCTRENMRVCTQAQNLRNRKKKSGGTSEFKGVWWDTDSRKWAAGISTQGKTIKLGRFDNEAVAAMAYDAAAKKYFGQYAKLNFPAKENHD